MTPDVDDFLAHYGKKGMKWGVRKPSTDDGDKKLSRREVRKLNREGERDFNMKKLNNIYDESKRGGEKVLVETSFDRGFTRDVMTGKQFVEHVERGGWVNADSTEIFARQAKAGEQFVLNMDRDVRYQPIKR